MNIEFICPNCGNQENYDNWFDIRENPEDGEIFEHECENCGEDIRLMTDIYTQITFEVVKEEIIDAEINQTD